MTRLLKILSRLSGALRREAVQGYSSAVSHINKETPIIVALIQATSTCLLSFFRPLYQKNRYHLQALQNQIVYKDYILAPLKKELYNLFPTLLVLFQSYSNNRLIINQTAYKCQRRRYNMYPDTSQLLRNN